MWVLVLGFLIGKGTSLGRTCNYLQTLKTQDRNLILADLLAGLLQYSKSRTKLLTHVKDHEPLYFALLLTRRAICYKSRFELSFVAKVPKMKDCIALIL